MMNLDMVGRLRDNRAGRAGQRQRRRVGGAACAPPARDLRLRATWPATATAPATRRRSTRPGVPVLHFFTGAHADYHKPSDTADAINAAGAAAIADAGRAGGAGAGRGPRS